MSEAILCTWSFIQWMGAAIGGLLFVYLAARLVSAAYFKSKHDHDSMKGL